MSGRPNLRAQIALLVLVVLGLSYLPLLTGVPVEFWPGTFTLAVAALTVLVAWLGVTVIAAPRLDTIDHLKVALDRLSTDPDQAVVLPGKAPAELAPLVDAVSLLQVESRYQSLRRDLAGRLSTDVLLDIDPAAGTFWANARLAGLLGETAETLENRLDRLVSRINPAERAAIETAWAGFLAPDGGEFEHSFRLTHHDGTDRWVVARALADRDRSGEATRAVMLLEDVTEAKRLEAQRLRAAMHCPLTGLPNRVLFMEQLEEALGEIKAADGANGALLYLDLDRFKAINDGLGQAAGDDMLTGVARLLRRVTAGRGFAARIGSDQFAILAPTVSDSAAGLALAEAIGEAMGQPFLLQGQEVYISVSIGVASLTAGYARAEDVLADAGFAMEQSKAERLGGIKFYERSHRVRSSVETLTLEADLRRALERDEFTLEYQPIVSLETDRIAGFEALMRWERLRDGTVQPDIFVPLAEDSGQIVPIGAWALGEACRQVAGWNARPGQRETPLFLSVNVSRRQLDDPGLVDTVSAAIAAAGIDPAWLKLEITEGLIMHRPVETAQVLTRLKSLGVGLAIDDFGTGYSSLSRLHALPFDTIKIDRSFVTDILIDPDRATIVQAVVNLADALGQQVVAEGVETSADVETLRRAHCDLVQGYFFGRPMAAADAERLMASDSRRRFTVREGAGAGE